MNYCNVYLQSSPIAQPILVGIKQKYIQKSTKIEVSMQIRPCKLLPRAIVPNQVFMRPPGNMSQSVMIFPLQTRIKAK